MTRKPDEIRSDLNAQILEVINSAITEKVLPSIQNVLGVQNSETNANRDQQSGRLNRSAEDHFSHVEHQSQGLNEDLKECSNGVNHWSNGLNNKGSRDQSCHAAYKFRGLYRGLRVYSGQTDHQSNRPNENSGEQYSLVDHMSTVPDKGSKCYRGVLAHKSIRPDASSGEHLGPQDQQNNSKLNLKFSSQRGLNREISTDSQTSDHDCDNEDTSSLLPNRHLDRADALPSFLFEVPFSMPFLDHSAIVVWGHVLFLQQLFSSFSWAFFVRVLPKNHGKLHPLGMKRHRLTFLPCRRRRRHRHRHGHRHGHRHRHRHRHLDQTHPSSLSLWFVVICCGLKSPWMNSKDFNQHEVLLFHHP